jgi:aromatic-L-amino-acid decarboxylase
MRERALEWRGNREGLSGKSAVRLYASTQTHSSIDKAAWIAGIGQDNLVKIPTDQYLAMDVSALRASIKQDRENGLVPAGVVVCVGGTSTGATDDVAAVCEVAREEGLYSHVDAAWAGSAMVCPEFRHLWSGVELADSVVLNPHKWLGASMECSAHFVRDPETLVRTLAIQPEYLKTHGKDDVVNFSEWSVQLGRRFRALKIWFLLRAYGLEGLRERIRNHIAWARDLAERLAGEPDFEIATPPVLSLFSFRYLPKASATSEEPETGSLDPDALNLRLLNAINDDGRIYLNQTRHDGKLVIRFVAGQFETGAEDFELAFDTICETARALTD